MTHESAALLIEKALKRLKPDTPFGDSFEEDLKYVCPELRRYSNTQITEMLKEYQRG